MVAAAADLAAATVPVEITHQTGVRDLDLVRSAYGRAGVTARVEPFLYEMHREMSAADVLVCRAGATTLAEIAAAGRAAILIPLPTATDDHQRRNADVLAAAGAADVMDQRDVTGSRLAARIVDLAGDAARRERMAAAVRAMARPDAADRIVDRVVELAAGR
jgi:UDP-N-acetylglucosamine--N-acetylmuramyl-(pentapeptide) pyrophosphoryl-undecaprenol N-acetylglucosamine transferase